MAIGAIVTAIGGIAAYKGGTAILGSILGQVRGIPPVSAPATRSVGALRSAFAGLGPMAVNLRTGLTGLGTVMKSSIAVGAAVGAVEIGRLGHALWQAESAETAVEKRAHAAAQAFRTLAGESPGLAALLDHVGDSSARVTGLNDQQLAKLRELIHAKNQAITSERSRLELEEERPVLGLLTDHRQRLKELDAEEQRLMETLRASAQAERERGEAVTSSMDGQKAGIDQVASAVDNVQEKTATPSSLTVETGESLARIESVQAALDRLRDKTVTVTVVTRNVEKHATGGMVGAQRLIGGGGVPGFGGGDIVDVSLEPGEQVIRKERAEPFRGLLEFINSAPIDQVWKVLGSRPGFQLGGVVGNLQLPSLPRLAMATGGQVASPPVEGVVRLEMTMNGRPAASIAGPRQQVRQLVDALKELQRGAR